MTLTIGKLKELIAKAPDSARFVIEHPKGFEYDIDKLQLSCVKPYSENECKFVDNVVCFKVTIK